MSKHTPGPWEARKLGEGWGIIAVNPMRGRIDSAITGMTKENAELCAAAPDLLQALRVLVREVGGSLQGYGRLEKPIENACAAIAKAEGTS